MVRMHAIRGAVAALVLGGGVVAIAVAQDGRPARVEPPAGGGPDIGLMLLEGLKATEGCLGTDIGQMQSGKNVIVAWFENAAAARRWYDSPIHRRMMEMAGGGPEKALQHAPEDVPLMVVASITPTRGQSVMPGFPMPISQIAIEIFTGVPGGAAMNGRFSPDGFAVPHLKMLETPAAAAPAKP